MNKNSKVKFIFLFFFMFFVLFAISNKNKLDTDFFSLIHEEEVKSYKGLFDGISKRLNSELIFLVGDLNNSKLLIDKLEQSNLFEKIIYDSRGDFSQLFMDLNKSKLALIGKEDLDLIKNKPSAFFQKNAQDFFSPFKNRVLDMHDDFFNFSKNGLKNYTKVYLNPKDGLLHVDDENISYFFINARLKKSYDSSLLLDTIYQIQSINDPHLLLSGAAIYTALGKEKGQSQSLYMSFISLFLTAFLLLFAFRKFYIFYLAFVAIFGLSFGIASTFFFFAKVHIISLVLSSSLVGLMYDFAIHWLSFNTKNSYILPIKNMLKIFLIGLFVTTSGYAFFAFAPLDILKQTAIFSIFALIGAFLCTYFLLPILFESKQIKASLIFLNYVRSYENMLKKVLNFLNFKTSVFIACIFILAFIYTFSSMNFNDNIRSYASTPDYWILQAKKISQITKVDTQSRFLAFDDKNTKEIFLNEAKKQNLIKNYTHLDKYFLSLHEQEQIKNLFLRYSNEEKFLNIYKDFGFSEDLLVKAFKSVQNLKALSAEDLLNLKSFEHLKHFLYKNKDIVYIDTNNSKKVKLLAQKYGVDYFDFVESLNKSFQNLKNLSILLKLLAFVFAFIFLSYFYGFKKSFFMVGLVLLSTFITLFILNVFGFHINIFSVFGLILSSAIGIDYMIFAFNNALEDIQKLFAILLASLTTMSSFFVLIFASTEAVQIFGISVGISVGLNAFFASLLAIKK